MADKLGLGIVPGLGALDAKPQIGFDAKCMDTPLVNPTFPGTVELLDECRFQSRMALENGSISKAIQRTLIYCCGSCRLIEFPFQFKNLPRS